MSQAQEPTPTATHPTSGTHAPSRFLPDGDITDQVFQATYARTSTIVERRPPLDLVIASISVFLRHIHPWLPLLDVQRVLSELVTTREPSLLLNAIFGASLPYLYDPRLDQTTSDSFWKYTKRKIFIEATEEPSYASLEACTILTLDLSGMTNGPQVWSRLAVITKLAAQLRTLGGRVLRPSVQTNESESGPSTKPGSKQHARLFWAIYALDSFISITTNQPPQLADFYLRSFLPTRDSTWKESGEEATSRHSSGPRLPAATSLFLYQLEILDISRGIHSVYLEYVTSQDQSDCPQEQILQRLLEESDKPLSWLQGLPSSLTLSPTTHPLVIMVHAYSHALTLFAKGFLMFSSSSSPGSPLTSRQVIDKLAEDGSHSVSAIVQLCNQAVGSMGDQLGWPFAWSIWVAARYLLVSAARQSSSLQAGFYTLVKALNRMGRYWQISKKYWRLLCRAEESLRQGGDAPSSRLLAAVMDLSVSTSDLEDQFRIDPVLCHTKSQGDSTAQSSAVSVVEDTTMTVGDQSLFTADDAGFGHDQYFSDTWFTSPLFASSAFQIEPGSVGDVQPGTWGL